MNNWNATNKEEKPTELIRDKDRVNQSFDFKGLEKGNIHPTDIDGILEVDNKHMIILEAKLFGSNFQLGQDLLQKRLVDKWETHPDDGHAVLLSVFHNVPSNESIPMTELVWYVYSKGIRTTIRPELRITVKKFMENLGAIWGNEKLTGWK
jgi:hypothetical protein